MTTEEDELNRRVAVTVMGWRLEEVDFGVESPRPGWHLYAPGENEPSESCYDARYGKVKASISRPSLPDYCTELVDAFAVVERLREGGWNPHFIGLLDGGWTVSLHEQERPWRFRACSAESLPLAICRAALQAVGESG